MSEKEKQFEHVSIRVERNVKNQLITLAKKDGRTLNNYVNVLFKEKINSQKKD